MQKVAFAILGAGSLGSILGAHLARAGHSVVMLARGRRALQVEQLGLRIRGRVDISQTVPVLTEPSRLPAVGVLIVATKTYGTEAALAPLRGAAIDCAFSIQNGLMKNDLLGDAFGRERVLGALANISGEMLPSGEVLFTRNANLYVGELDGGESQRARQVAHTIDAAGVRCTAVTDIQSLEWSKFAAWVAMMVLSVTTRAVTWKYAVDPESALVLARLVREMGVLASARHIQLSDDAVLPVASICQGGEQAAVQAIQRVGRELKSGAPEHRMSTLQDLQAGRPLEIEETLHYAVRLAQQCRLSVPLLEAFYALLAAVDRLREQRSSAPSPE
jgi:2-dehydropantoate 2-reductase